MSEEFAVRLRRRVPAPPARVYRAWLDPAIMQRWFAPTGFTVSRAEVDERVGGRHQVWQDDSSGVAGGFDSEIEELVPDERIVFRWRFVGPDRVVVPRHDSRLTVTFRPAEDGGTELELVHEQLDALRADLPFVADNIESGWIAALGQLVAHIGRKDES